MNTSVHESSESHRSMPINIQKDVQVHILNVNRHLYEIMYTTVNLILYSNNALHDNDVARRRVLAESFRYYK